VAVSLVQIHELQEAAGESCQSVPKKSGLYGFHQSTLNERKSVYSIVQVAFT
jgi:hypothetical protein